MVADAAQTGMITTLVTNGALLTQKRVDALAEGGLASVYISIDAASYKVHDSNRGLPGLSARIRRANAALKRHQIPSSATIRSSNMSVAASDGMHAASQGDVREAWNHWVDRRNLVSARAAIRTVTAPLPRPG